MYLHLGQIILGQKLALSVHTLAALRDNPEAFKAHARDVVLRHLRLNVHLENNLWNVSLNSAIVKKST